MKNFLILFSLTFVACAPLFNSGLYTSQDGPNHLIRLAYFSKNLQSGRFFPGWIDDLNYGRGYPIFYFVYPLPYYISSLWHFMGLSLVDSLKFTLFLSTFMGALGMYTWTKKLSAAIIYLFTPYVFLNLFVRLAFGEVVFLAVLPWALWANSSIPIALMVLSHLQLSTVFLPAIFLYKLVCKTKAKDVFRQLILGLVITSFFWLPAISLAALTKYSETHQFIPSLHLPTFTQLVYSKWGYGFSTEGQNDGLSFQLGLANWIILGVSTLAALIKRRPSIIFWSITAWAAILLMVSNPFGIWAWPVFSQIQFPWRLLALTTVSTAFLFSTFSPRLPRLVIVFVILLAIYSNRNHIRINMPDFTNVQDKSLLVSNTTTTSTPDEFMPKTSKKDFLSQPVIIISRLVSVIGLLGLLGIKSSHA